MRAGRVYEIPGAWIATVSHHAAQGLARVARVLHPEAFAGALSRAARRAHCGAASCAVVVRVVGVVRPTPLVEVFLGRSAR